MIQIEPAIKLKGIIFDLDGTLGNTLPVCFAAFRRALQQFSSGDYTNDEIAALFGPSEEGIIQRVVHSQWEACLQTYLIEYEKAHSLCAQPFAGIEAALSLCKHNQIALAIVTGKGQYSTAISLRYMGLADYFEIVETGCAEGAIKTVSIQNVLTQWNLLPQNVAYVGDSPYDMSAAKQVGVIPLAAAWAETTSVESLNQMAPAATFSTVESLIDWICTHRM